MNISGPSRSTPNLKNEINGPAGIGVGGGISRNDAYVPSFYAEPPHFELSLDEFEEFAIARLKVRCLFHFMSLTK